jgi:hypothetical protein
MSKSGAPATARPREVLYALIALIVSGAFVVVSALAILTQRDWLNREQGKANAKAITSAVSSATASAAKVKHDVPAAAASASSSAVKKYPTGGSELHDQVTRQLQSAALSTLLIVLVLALLIFGTYRGRHWTRWGVTGFWVLSTITTTSIGLLGVINGLFGTLPVAVRIPTVVAGLALIVAVVLVNLKPSVAFFAQNRPVPPAGAPARRGLFAPRQPVTRGPGAGTGRSSGSVLSSTAASRGEKYVERQRSKKRANAESAARGAELARSRAKSSRSRRDAGR